MKPSTVFLIIGLIVLGVGGLLAVDRDDVEAESSATAECGMLELVVRQTGHNARGRPLYRMEATFVHQGVVYDERAPFVPRRNGEREDIDRTASFGWGAFFYHEDEPFADVDRDNAQNRHGNNNIEDPKWNEVTEEINRGTSAGFGRRTTRIVATDIEKPWEWHVVGVTYAAYGPLNDPGTDPWLAQMKAVSEYNITTVPLSLRKSHYRVQGSEWPQDANDWGRWAAWRDS